MAIIQTARNFVCAYDPQPDDIFCRVVWKGPESWVRFPMQRIEEYDGLVEWALAMADCMVHPIHVYTLNHRDIICTNRVEQFLELAERLTSRADRATWEDALDVCIDAAWHNPDEAIRRRAGAVLLKTGVQVPPKPEGEVL